VDFRLLGPLEVVGDAGRALPLGAGRRRALLAYLLLRANEPVASERLIDALWGETPPATAAQMVQNQVWALRRALGGNGRLETLGHAYRLNIAPGERDVDRFETFVGAGEFRKGLALWRGPPLADLTYEPFAQAEIARLTELRWAALEACMEAELAAGRHTDLVAELEAAVLEQPLRERLQGQLMLALYRSGRQADALEAYRRARTTLVDDIGVEPGAELRALHAAILAQDPGLAAPPALPPALAGGSPVLAGRDDELATLRDRLHEGGVVVVTGPAGIGKTRLAAELARETVRRGMPATYTTNPAEAAGRRGLVIVDDARDDAVPTADADALVLVLRRGEGGDLPLAPLGHAAVAQIAALYLTPEAAEAQAAALAAATGSIPLDVHRTAAAWARREAATLVADSAHRTASGRSDLRAAEADLAGSVIGLQAAVERDRLYAADAARETAVCPYLGLATFDSDHAEYFFGRERLVAELVARLVGAPLLAVVGPSGSGKSSAVRAGLLPALAAGVLPGSERWTRVLMRPGAHPREKLDRLLVREDRVVLAVDQFEELFTACTDAAEREAFVDALVAAAHEGVVVVIAMRTDFYGRCAPYPELARLIGANQVLVGPMRPAELQRAIELPARRAGLTVEPELTAALIDDVVDAPGALPLLSAALLELWRERDGRVLRRASYDRTGGVRGAIGRLAEETYGRLGEAERETARLSLVRLADAGEHEMAFVRRRAPLEEFGPESTEILDALADSRLVTIADDTVEVAHEALLREWPRLRHWLEDDAEGRRLHQHLIQAAREWEAADHDPAELYRGARLTAALDWVAGHERELNERERAFVAASRAGAEQESDRQHRANRRLRMLTVGIAGVLFVALAAGVIAVQQRGEARGAAVVADAQRLGAEALVDDRLDHALLIARAGVALDDTVATRSSMLSVLLRTPAALGVIDHGWKLYTVALRPDRRVLAVGDERGGVTFYDAATREPVGRPYSIPGGLIQNLDYSPDGRTLAAGSVDPNDPDDNAVVDLIDARTHTRRARVRLTPIRSPAPFVAAGVNVLADGDVLVQQRDGGAPDGRPSVLYRVDGTTGRVEKHRRIGQHGSRVLTLTADGRHAFVTSARDDRTWEVDPRTLRVTRTYATGAISGGVSPDGRLLALGDLDGRVRLLDVASGAVRPFSGRHKGAVLTLAFTPDDRTLVTTADDNGRVNAWDVASGRIAQTFAGHTGAVGGLAISPDGRTAISASEDGRAVIWDLAGDRRLDQPFPTRRPFTVEDTPRGIAVRPDGRTLALTDSDGSVELIDTRTLKLRGTLHAQTGFAAGVDFSPDGRLLAVCGEHGRVTLWEADTLAPAGDLEGLGGGACQGVVFSPDGTHVAASDFDFDKSRLRVWDIRTGQLTAYRSPTGAALLAYSPDGRLIAAAAIDKDTEIRDAATGRLVKRITTDDESRSVAFSPDGRRLVVGQYDGEAILYSTADWLPVGRPIEAHTARLTYPDFSPDGRTLLTAGADGTAALWDVASRKPIGEPLKFPRGSFVAAAFSPDGQYVYAVPPRGPGTRFDMSPAAWERHACLVAGRELTEREWADALPGRAYRHICSG
jgi:WD40 repeat protein/DNA-binding SARP family transcriptional activator